MFKNERLIYISFTLGILRIYCRTLHEALLDALEYSIAPQDDDFERAPTELMPNYAQFATDMR